MQQLSAADISSKSHFTGFATWPGHILSLIQEGQLLVTCERMCTNYWGGRVVRRYWVNSQCRGVLLIWIIVGQGPIALAAGAGWGCLDIFLSSVFSLFFPPL